MCPDGAPDPVALWTSSAFLESARTWVAAQLGPGGIRLTGEWQQTHARVWSSTIRFETTEGRIWFKVNGLGTVYEAKLVALLDELCPGLAPQLLAYDDAVAWSITETVGRCSGRKRSLTHCGGIGSGCFLDTARRSSPSPPI